MCKLFQMMTLFTLLLAGKAFCDNEPYGTGMPDIDDKPDIIEIRTL